MDGELENLRKNTNNDFRRYQQDAVSKKFGGYAIDHDENYIYFEKWESEGDDYGSYIDYRVTYTSEETGVILGDNAEKVVRYTGYNVVTKSNESSIADKIIKHLDNIFGGSKNNTHNVYKKFDDEEMIAVEPLYISVNEVDGQGDTVDSIEEMYKLVSSLNKANEDGILQSSLFHNHKTQSFSVIKAWVNECDCFIGDELVPEGQPIAKIQFHNPKAWELRKEGTLTGLSIGARAKVENLSDD